MDITRTDVDELNAQLTIKLDPKDYQERVGSILSDYKKKMNMPGFRPGKVPMGMVKKMYGKAVLAEELNKVFSDNLMKVPYGEQIGRSWSTPSKRRKQQQD